MVAIICVSMGPGQTALTRTLDRGASRAEALVNPTRACFGNRVGGHPDAGAKTSDRGDVDNGSAPVFCHVAKDRFGEKKSRSELDLKHPVQVAQFEFIDGGRRTFNTSVVADNLDSTGQLHGLPEDRPHRASVSKIGGEPVNFATPVFAKVTLLVSRQDFVALRKEPLGQSPADSASGTGDECELSRTHVVMPASESVEFAVAASRGAGRRRPDDPNLHTVERDGKDMERAPGNVLPERIHVEKDQSIAEDPDDKEPTQRADDGSAASAQARSAENHGLRDAQLESNRRD